MNKVQIEIQVNEIVNHVIAGGKVEDDHVEAKREWPKLDKAGQLAGMANAAGGYPILWIVGLCEGSHQVLPLDDTDPASWWQQMQGDFAYGVAPSLKSLRVVTDHGSVMALQFETDQAPYLVKLPKVPKDPNNPLSGYRWATAAVPWREGTSNRTATRAELLSILSASAAVPGLEMVSGNVAVYDESEATIPPPPMRLTLSGSLLIDTQPGVHILFPEHRQRFTLTTSNGDEIDCSEVTFTTQSPVNATDNNGYTTRYQSMHKPINPHGATERPTGLVVLAPDIVRVSVTVDVPHDLALTLLPAEWLDLRASLPIGTSNQAATLRQRLLPSDRKPKFSGVKTRRVGFWTTSDTTDEDD